MTSARSKMVWVAVVVVVLGWVAAIGGYQIAKASRMTAEKVLAYLKSRDLNQLKGEERARALKELSRKMNALDIDERRRARAGGSWDKWFQAMTDAEKIEFIESTLPSGFKQMLNSFEELPEAKRRQAVDRAIVEMRKAREEMREFDSAEEEDELDPEMQKKVVQIGLKTFYSQSSAQTKAELAPLLEEMQRLMESGMLFRGRPRRD